MEGCHGRDYVFRCRSENRERLSEPGVSLLAGALGMGWFEQLQFQ